MTIESELLAIRDSYTKSTWRLWFSNTHYNQRAQDVFKIAISLCTQPDQLKLVATLFYHESALLAGESPTTPICNLPQDYRLYMTDHTLNASKKTAEESGYYRALQAGLIACLKQLTDNDSGVNQEQIQIVKPDKIGHDYTILDVEKHYMTSGTTAKQGRAKSIQFYGDTWKLRRHNSFVLDGPGTILGTNPTLERNAAYIFCLYYNRVLERAQMRLLFIHPMDEDEQPGRRTHESLAHLGAFDTRDDKALQQFVTRGADPRLQVLLAGWLKTDINNPNQISINNGSGHFLPSAHDLMQLEAVLQYFFPPQCTISVAHQPYR